MRIISGTHKGKIITPDKNFKARPTTDFAKEILRMPPYWIFLQEREVSVTNSHPGGQGK